MAIPNVRSALRGWTKKREVRIVTKKVVNHINTQIAEIIVSDIMVQPLQPEKVRRKPEEQRAWKWYDLVTTIQSRIMKIDDIIYIEGHYFRIDSVQPWTEAGYRRYEATEDFTGYGPMQKLVYDGNGAESGSSPATYAYQTAAIVIVLGNTGTLAKAGYIFSGWNTEANGSGTSYSAGNNITIASADIALYAQWVEAST